MRIRALVSIVLFGFIFTLSVLTGYWAGFHHRISPDEWGRSVFAIASALTANVYGLSGGVYFEPVADALQNAGITAIPEKLSKLGISFPDNLYSSDVIDAAIQHASSLPLQIPPPNQQTEAYNVRGFGGDDVGYGDFIRLSFSMFSPKIESVYLLYISLLTTSMILLLVALKPDSAYFGAPLTFVIIYYFLVTSPLFGNNVIGYASFLEKFVKLPATTMLWASPMTPHFLTTLAILPLLHVFAVSCKRVAMTPAQALCVAGQSLIAAFVIHIRATAFWILIAISLVPLLAMFQWVGSRQTIPISTARLYHRVRAISKSWAIILFLAIIAAANIYFQSRLHPVYQSGTSVSRHAFWTEVFYGLQWHPEWMHKYGEAYKLNGQPALLDDLPIAAVQTYLQQHPPSAEQRNEIFDELGALRWRAINEYTFYAFWEFAKADPVFVLQLFYYKVERILLELTKAGVLVFGGRSFFDYALLGAVFIFVSCAAVSQFGEARTVSNYRRYVILIALSVPVSLLPNLATFVSGKVMADSIVLSLVATLLGSAYGTAMLFRQVLPYDWSGRDREPAAFARGRLERTEPVSRDPKTGTG